MSKNEKDISIEERNADSATPEPDNGVTEQAEANRHQNPPRETAEVEVKASKSEPTKLTAETGTPVENSSEDVECQPEMVQLPEKEYRELQAKAAKAEENWDLYLRVRAELDNFRKRAARDRQEAVRYANEVLLERLLPILDNFEMALQAMDQSDTATVESIRTGVAMIHGQLKNFLNESGIEEINAIGQTFDHNLHEAISQEETDSAEEGTVLQQIRKGYKLRERLLRPASVVVAKNAGSE